MFEEEVVEGVLRGGRRTQSPGEQATDEGGNGVDLDVFGVGVLATGFAETEAGQESFDRPDGEGGANIWERFGGREKEGRCQNDGIERMGGAEVFEQGDEVGADVGMVWTEPGRRSMFEGVGGGHFRMSGGGEGVVAGVDPDSEGEIAFGTEIGQPGEGIAGAHVGGKDGFESRVAISIGVGAEPESAGSGVEARDIGGARAELCLGRRVHSQGQAGDSEGVLENVQCGLQAAIFEIPQVGDDE